MVPSCDQQADVFIKRITSSTFSLPFLSSIRGPSGVSIVRKEKAEAQFDSNFLFANSANDQTASLDMDSDQLQDWIKATAAASTLHRRLLTVLESTAEEHSSRTGTRSPTNQPILTSDACRAILMITTSAGGGIYQALRRLLRSSFTDR